LEQDAAPRPGILLVYDLLTASSSSSSIGDGSGGGADGVQQSTPRLIWCFLPFNVLFGFASALFTFWINGSVAAAAGADATPLARRPFLTLSACQSALLMSAT
jgi:hypothetical protein